MGTIYFGILSVSGLLVGLLVFGIVYFDTNRRGVFGVRRLLLAAGFGISSLGSFFVPYIFKSQFQNIYFNLIKPRPITASPYEWVTISIATGLLISVVAVGFYIAGTRYSMTQRISNIS